LRAGSVIPCLARHPRSAAPRAAKPERAPGVVPVPAEAEAGALLEELVVLDELPQAASSTAASASASAAPATVLNRLLMICGIDL
jgi:hypothetical protein